jgi:hypothetical protein
VRLVREPKASWVRALRDLTGHETDDIRWNEALGRWEFVMAGADGVPRSQFWGHFDRPVDRVTGMYPARELDDDGMREALANLAKTFVGNPYDGAGSTRAEVLRRYKWNKAEGKKRYVQAGQDFADMTLTVGGRGHRLRGATASHATGSVASRARRIEIPTVIGGKKHEAA